MPAVMIDCSALKDIFEGKNSGSELLKKFSELNEKGIKIKVVTPMASFLRALYLTDSDTKIQSIQKTLNFLEIGYSTADFRVEKEVTDEIIKIINLMSKFGKNG